MYRKYKAIPNQKACEADPDQDEEAGDTVEDNNEPVKISLLIYFLIVNFVEFSSSICYHAKVWYNINHH